MSCLDDELVALLACPRCKGPLERDGERLACPACRLVFPVRDRVPVLLLEEAQPAETGYRRS
jgi:hypothetical protein